MKRAGNSAPSGAATCPSTGGAPPTRRVLHPGGYGSYRPAFSGHRGVVARDSFAAGDFRWVAQVVNHVVFAAPDNAEARALQADALEQLLDSLAVRVDGPHS
ncbi:alkyl sulfatase dimerization domain-containing protein [Streptomyces sp. TRM 70351]|uniref:alkyl sulfatase dimerization domain-containing protein n=1 Tax=Streptomyces sp. TRM 70351 TaxID=3116552 RepID=UPI002E7BE414|nr:alkyl sulfatase dimerization domain-containing protein [Streptomyces sp. TRM 70351]MEE1926683.1 alkyl sulfatase dimerization domain-containing protein [Streptomyces sp. TRM 70351]